MKKRLPILLITVVPLLFGCGSNSKSSSSGGGNNNGGNDPGNNDPVKVVVNAHTLSDSNPPITIDGDGNRVSSQVWSSYQSRNSSTLSQIYNFTYSYKILSGGTTMGTQKFTKNGYYASSSSGGLYYEKIGSIYYEYVSVSDGRLRQRATVDVSNKYVEVLSNDINVHMFDMNYYEYNPDMFDGSYIYYGSGFTSVVKFQGDYLTKLSYNIPGTCYYDIEAVFDTTIEIPKSYYYK